MVKINLPALILVFIVVMIANQLTSIISGDSRKLDLQTTIQEHLIKENTQLKTEIKQIDATIHSRTQYIKQLENEKLSLQTYLLNISVNPAIRDSLRAVLNPK